MTTAKQSFDFNIHGATARVNRSGSLVWINVPLNPSEPFDNLLTVFLAPDVAAALGESLVREAQTAQQIAALDAPVDAPEAIPA